MTDADRAIYEEVYPLIKAIEDRLGMGIALSLWANLSRKLATRSIPLDRLHKILDKQYQHQVAYNKRQEH